MILTFAGSMRRGFAPAGTSVYVTVARPCTVAATTSIVRPFADQRSVVPAPPDTTMVTPDNGTPPCVTVPEIDWYINTGVPEKSNPPWLETWLEKLREAGANVYPARLGVIVPVQPYETVQE